VRPIAGAPGEGVLQASHALVDVSELEFTTPKAAVVKQRRDARGRHARERVENQVVLVCKREYKTLDQADRKLAGMACLLWMVAFDVGNGPHVFRVFPQWITRDQSLAWPLEVFLAGVLGWNANGIEIEFVAIRLRVPKHDLVPAREASPRMQAVSKVPDDAVAELKVVALEDRCKHDIERQDLAIGDVVPYLPTD